MPDLLEAERVGTFNCIQIALLSRKEFDAFDFDHRAIGLHLDTYTKQSRLKYVVVENVMYVFARSFSTLDACQIVLKKKPLKEGLVGSAGLITVLFNKDKTERVLSDFSRQLQDRGILSQRDSDVFKSNFLYPILGGAFTIHNNFYF